LFDYNYVQQRYGGTGRTLGSFLAEAINGVLELETPESDVRPVSLAPFTEGNPDHFLVFRFIESDHGFDDIDYGNGVVLDEYELPADRPQGEFTPSPWADHDPDGAFPDYQLPPGASSAR
jgi:hypothetical protein